jgi:CubicO group peptidase (beta-lactamase class C family)
MIKDKYDFSEIENQIKQDIKLNKIPSVAMAVAKDGKIIYEKTFGYADIENKIESTIETSYQLASVTKTMTATAIMILDKKTDFNIYEPIEKYINPLKFKIFEGVSSDVKTIDILNHTSGLGTYMQIKYLDEDVASDDFETAFNKYGALFHPVGLISEYSNLGYGLLSYIIEKRSSKTFSEFMEDELFKPLKMVNTFIDSPKKEGISIAKKYGSNLSPLPEMINNTKGAGNAYASVHDLILFGMFNLKNNNEKLLDAKTIDLMHSYINKYSMYHYYDSTYYGLGWYFKPNDHGYKIIWHEGGMKGVSSMIKLIPEENIAITVILNTSNQQYCQKITNQLSKIILPKYNPSQMNEVAEYKSYTFDTTYFGDWKGIIKVRELDIPCTLKIQSDGNLIIDYLDYTYKSYFTQDSPIPNKTFLLTGLVNKNSFIGMFPGDLPSDDIRHEFSQFMSLKLFKNDNILSGTIVALAAADREYYAYPYYIRLEKQ